MTEKESSYFEEYIHTLLSQEKDILLMKHSNALCIQTEDMNRMAAKIKDYRIIYHPYDFYKLRKPYEPFLDIIRDFLKEKQETDKEFSIESFLEQTEVYPMHRQIFQSYFQDEKCKRQDEIIIGEYQYEKRKFQNALFAMLKKITEEQPICLVLNEVNCAGSSVLMMMGEILKQHWNHQIKIMAVFNETGEVLSFAKDQINRCVRLCEENDVVCNWIFETVEENEETFITDQKQKRNVSEYIILGHIPELSNLFYTLEFEQAAYYLKSILERLETELINIDAEKEQEMLRVYFWISLEMGEYSYALFLCDKLEQLKFKDEKEKQKNHFEKRYFKTLVYLYSGNQAQMKEELARCEESAQKTKDDKMLFQAALLKNMSLYSGWKDLWISENDTEVEEEFIEQCIRYGYENHLAHIYAYSFNNDYRNFTTIEGIEERISEFNKGIALGEKLQNEQFLIEAYRKNVMLASIHGYFHVCIYFYKKTLEIAKKSKDEVEEEGIYNGLGYSNCGLGHYEEANSYYNKALILYYKNVMLDDIVETLYNLGINAILAEDYENASAYLLEADNILRMLKQNTIRSCNISKLFGLISLSSFRQGIMYRAHLYLNNAKQHLAHILGKENEEEEYFVDDSMFLVYFVSGLMKKKDKNYQSAVKDFDNAEFYMKRSTGAMFFNYPQFAIEKYRLWMALGRAEEAEDILLECMEYCKENHYSYQEQKIEEILGNEVPKDQKITFAKMELEDISIYDISTMVKSECIKKEKNDMVRTIRFFNVLQKFTNYMTGTIKEESENVIPVFKSYFYIDKVMMLRRTDGCNDVIYSDVGFEISEETADYIVNYFYAKPSGFVVSKNGVEHEEYDKIMSLFSDARIFSFAAVPIFENEILKSVFIACIEMKDSWTSTKKRAILDQEDLEVFTYVFRQISGALDKLEVRKKLEEVNVQLKNQMEQLIELKNEAEAANEAKSNFLANMSHEIRTPMNAIIGMAEIVMREKLSWEQKQKIEQIHSAGKNLLAIINDILDFSKIESGKMEIREDTYQLSEVIADVKNILATRAAEKLLRLKMMVNQDIPMTLYGDDMRIRQIIINLGNNAIKFTEKGSVTIVVDYEPDGENILLKVEVHDTGIGIKPEDQKKLFTSFQQVDGKRNRKIEGTGLGLSITKALITLMGGTVSLKSEYGVGSTFSFEIPQKVMNETEVVHTKEEVVEKFTAPDAKILVVDDNQMNLSVAEGLLQPLKMQIDLAESGFRAIDMIKQNQYYDIVFMDHMMPELDGIETTKKIRELEGNYYKELPIIALTANAINGVKEMFLENGMNDFLAKPIDMKQMTMMLWKWLPKDKIVVENMAYTKQNKVVEGSAAQTDMIQSSKFCKSRYLSEFQIENEEAKALGMENGREDTEEKLPEIQGLDVKKAVQTSGTLEIFMKLLQVFYDTLPAKTKLIRECEQEERVHEYTIEVHALKSAAKLIGAMELSKQAEYLEACGKEENIAEIHQKTPQLLQLYESYTEALASYVRKKEDKKKLGLSEEVCRKKIEQLATFLEDFDIDSADAMIEELSEYEYQEEFQTVFEKLKAAVENVSYEEAEQIIREYLQGK